MLQNIVEQVTWHIIRYVQFDHKKKFDYNII